MLSESPFEIDFAQQMAAHINPTTNFIKWPRNVISVYNKQFPIYFLPGLTLD